MIKAYHYAGIPELIAKGYKTEKPEMYEFIRSTGEYRNAVDRIELERKIEAIETFEDENPETIAFLNKVFYKE